MRSSHPLSTRKPAFVRPSQKTPTPAPSTPQREDLSEIVGKRYIPGTTVDCFVASTSLSRVTNNELYMHITTDALCSTFYPFGFDTSLNYKECFVNIIAADIPLRGKFYKDKDDLYKLTILEPYTLTTAPYVYSCTMMLENT
jgi:hypothetical protein